MNVSDCECFDFKHFESQQKCKVSEREELSIA